MEVDAVKEDQLIKYASLRGLNLGQAEKDYYQNIILFIIYSKNAKSLIFKGGTALSKCYGLNRFSEDLNFTVLEDGEFIEQIDEGLTNFSINHKINELQKGTKYKIKIEGILYKGSEKTLCSITIDLSRREKVILNPLLSNIGHHMDIIPVFEVCVMDKDEILAEKIRAIMSRTSARDLYDLVFLIRNGAIARKELIKEKLNFYALNFENKKLVDRLQLISPIWVSELKSLLKIVPNFQDFVKVVKTFFN